MCCNSGACQVSPFVKKITSPVMLLYQRDKGAFWPCIFIILYNLSKHGCHVKSSCPPSSSSCSSPLNKGLFAVSIGAKGSKWAYFTCLCIPNGLGWILEKHVFDPFFTHLWSQIGPDLRHFGIFEGPKPATTGSKRAKTTCFGIPRGLVSFLEKVIFSPPVDPNDLFGRPPDCPQVSTLPPHN